MNIFSKNNFTASRTGKTTKMHEVGVSFPKAIAK